MTLGLLLLAAGRSERFGTEDKLLTTVSGQPMVLAALGALSRPRVERRLAAVSSPEVAAVCEAAGCQTLMLPRGLGQGDSLSAGVRLLTGSVSRLLIGLGDMPWLPAEAVDALIDMRADQPACAAAHGIPMPPTVFPAGWLPVLAEAKGDVGARAVLRDLPAESIVEMPAGWLKDVDRPVDLG